MGTQNARVHPLYMESSTKHLSQFFPYEIVLYTFQFEQRKNACVTYLFIDQPKKSHFPLE